MTFILRDVAPLVVVGLFVLWMRHYLATYLAEKGRNLATKEDLGALTHEVEAVKLQYQRAGVVHQAQYQAEFATYRSIWDRLVDVQREAMSLRPMLDVALREGETREQRMIARLERFGVAFNAFTAEVWKNRPFYPDDIYKELMELTSLVHGEAIDYQYGEPRLDAEYWKEAHTNAQRISDKVERICTVIRERLANPGAA